MGPEATVDLMQKIIAHTSAIDDVDHVHCIIDNKLAAYGTDFLVIPCNTAHYYYNAVADTVNIPVVKMIALVVDTICTVFPAIQQIGILGSTTVIKNIFCTSDIDAIHNSFRLSLPMATAHTMQRIF